MSTVSSLLNNTANTTTSSNTTSSNGTTGIGSLTSSDFLNLMLTQLQQQDPLNPTDSNAMLQQISQISTLQANTQMQTSLQGLTLQQSIGAGGNLMGKNITGIDSTNHQVTGNVTSVQVQNSQVYLGLDTDANLVPMSNVMTIANPPPAAAAALAAAPATAVTTTPAANAASALQSILSAF